MQSASRCARPGPGSPRRLTNSIPPAASRPAGSAWMPARRRPSTPSSAKARRFWNRPRVNQRSRARFIAPGITHFPHVGADRCVRPSPVSAKTGAHAGAPLQNRRTNPMEGHGAPCPYESGCAPPGSRSAPPVSIEALAPSQQRLTGLEGRPSLGRGQRFESWSRSHSSMLLIFVTIGFLVLLPGANLAGSAGLDMRCAAKNYSTAPSYVLVTVVNTTSQERFVSAVTARNLQYALALEHELGNALTRQDPSAYQAIDKLIDEHPDLVFEFSFEPAIERLRPQYTEAMLKEARRDLANLDDKAILAGFAPDGNLHSLERKVGQAIVAHVLLERGFSVGRGDHIPSLNVGRTIPCP